jgi:hypothetical protein
METASSLRVVVNTTQHKNTRTNEDIWFDIGKHRWKLCDQNKINRKKGLEDVFELKIREDFDEKDILRILICKDPDDGYKKWHLEGLTVVLNKKIVYKNTTINHWLEDQKESEWLARDFNPIVAPPKNIIISEEEVKTSINKMLNTLFHTGTWNNLSLKGNLKAEIECMNIFVSQNFEANVSGPNPVLTLWMKLVPYIYEQNVEVRIRSYEVFADYPLWFEIVTLGISNLMEIHIQGGIKKMIKECIQELVHQKIKESAAEGFPAQISLRPHKIEILY